MIMSQEELEEPWGQLISTSNVAGTEEERVPVLGHKFLIGRDKDVELVVAENRFVSSRHCLLERDEKGGKWISDSSSNGTLLNGARLQRHKRVKLRDGNVIGVVFRRDKPDFNLSYRFQDLVPTDPSSEAGAGTEEEGDDTLDLTQSLDEDTENREDNDVVERRGGGCKRRLTEEESRSGPVATVDVEKDSKKAGQQEESASDLTKECLKKKDEEEEEEEAGSSKAGADVPALVKTGSIEQTLICQICQEIFHDCISLQPCMHCYCGGCYSEWMKDSNKCPACRCKVKRVNRNHLVNNLVEAFLRANPGKKRSEEDLKELNEKNKITRDMLYPKRRYDDDDYSHSDTDNSEYGSSPPPFIGGPSSFFGSGSASNFGGRPIPGQFHCRQCPTYVGPSPSSHPPPPTFTCSPSSTNHILCQCCFLPMPDRRAEADSNTPPQKCALCNQPFCHMYWGCSQPGCNGCLSLFKDMEVSEASLSSSINENPFEWNVLKDYLQGQSKTVKDMLRECISRLDSGQHHCSDLRITSDVVTCRRCALTPMKQLVYLYRSDIPTSDLPESARRRPDCHWGKNCRTQKHNASHAARYNHVCEQTRTS
ncbi:E3 ubiquitin-protein ligase CHFR [Geodia barretti]|uniref:E3 ubiquitin-protein ligase CHFR n=1 Tax=Geodia barretti TaxID=519541 RepID=A0AA35TJF5_GEOBA|nr:E3 ubiquitin-protein ligase CHFR [Geodia barretti]